MEDQARIRAFVADNLLFSSEGFQYSDDDSFLKEGIIDSLGVMELVAFAGSSFGISVAPEEVTSGNFDSVNKLTEFIRRKKALRSAEEPRAVAA